MCNCGIGEIIFTKVALYKSTFGGTEISLWGICATPNGLDNFKIMLKDKMETYNQTTITCACGNVLEVGSTKKDLKVDVCSKCHPYWTGNLRLDTKGGRADRFKKKYGLQ